MQKPPEGNHLSLEYDIHLSIWTLFVQIAFMEELYRVKTGIMVAITDQFLTINYGTYWDFWTCTDVMWIRQGNNNQWWIIMSKTAAMERN